ncbi:fimbrial protein [Lelliottia nimipressuralis]
MNMKKLVLAVAMSSAMGMGAANAADEGGGTINFTGAIIDSPCSITSDSATQEVDLGKIANVALADGGSSTPVPFHIQLKNCDVSVGKNSVQTTFGGAVDAGNPELLGITGSAKGAGIAITDGSGTLITLGTPSDAQKLMDGENTLAFSAYLQADSESASITPGEFSSVAQFSLSYN